MPYCTQCGNQVGPADVFCGACGARQGQADSKSDTGSTGFGQGTAFVGAASGAKRSSGGREDFLKGVNDRQASVFCYIPWVGWIAAIVVLASERFRDNKDVRFHAFQGLYLFVLWLFVDWAFPSFLGYIDSARIIGRLLKLSVLAAWIVMIIKTSQGVMLRLPFLGELADRSVSEQK